MDDYKIYLQYDMGSDAGVKERLALQRNLDRTFSVANSWNSSFSASKCVVVRFSHKFHRWNEKGRN